MKLEDDRFLKEFFNAVPTCPLESDDERYFSQRPSDLQHRRPLRDLRARMAKLLLMGNP